jgi:hypothetical protein
MQAFSFALALLSVQMPALDEELLEAARKGNLPAVQQLVAKGANLEAKSPYGQTPLYFAARNGHADVVRFLLGKGAKIDVRDTFYKMSLVGAAADKGGIDVVSALLEAGANGGDALSTAAYRGNKELLSLVLAKSKPTPQELSSALQTAEAARRPEIAELLRKAGAVAPPKPSAVVAPEKLAILAGTYKGPPVGEFIVQVKDGNLLGIMQGRSLEFGAFDDTTFGLIQAPHVTIKFTVENGKATKLIMNQSGNQMTLTRAEAQ